MIPEWLEKRYKILCDAFQGSPFRFEAAAKILKEKIHDDKKQINVILSELRKKGWLKVKMDTIDARKKIYTLKSKEDILTETFPLNKNSLTRGELESLLKGAADLIRTRVDYTFILVLLFYKRVSDKWAMEYDNAYKEALEDGLSKTEAQGEAKNSMYHDFDTSEELLWENIRKQPARLPENFSKAMKILADRNPELKDIFDNADFVQFTTNRENSEILRQLVELFSARSLQHVSPDILGDAYEWILRYFAPQKAKEGEVYTPREVIRLLIKILNPQPGESIYDPACGSGGMLISAYQYIKDQSGRDEADRFFLYGQEANHKTLALSKMNLYIHDIRNAQLLFGDTLLYPKFKDAEKTKSFDVVIANPPWNQDGYDEVTLKKGEFWLPEKLFYNTGAPGALLFLNKNKSEERKGKIFFINASKEFRQHPEVRKLNQLGDKNIQKIVNAFNNFTEEEGFSRAVEMDEIKENEYNLNVTLYVFPEEEVEDIDVNKEWRERRLLEKEIDEVDKKIEGYLKELREEN
jgi:type I restriction enzyme M protein